MILLAALAGAIVLACFIGLALEFPLAATAAWMLALETSPEMWLSNTQGGHETIIAILKAAGICLAACLAFRRGTRRDAYNPSLAFLWMFGAGLAHGLLAGVSLLDSLRSLLGSVAPFLFAFVVLAPDWRRTVIRTVTLAPLVSAATGFALQTAGLHAAYAIEVGAIRLAGPSEPPILAGFALSAIYAGLLQMLSRPSRTDAFLLGANFLILLLTGARAPLALALAIAVAAILLPSPHLTAPRRLTLLAAAGALTSLAIIFFDTLGFLRVVNLAEAGQVNGLSNRELIWPYFQRAIHDSPWVGWGAGAGKAVVPSDSIFSHLLGTNAAHNEYLRIGVEGGWLGVALLALLMGLWAWTRSRPLPPAERWFMRLVFVAFAIHSWTDNTLIATTSSILFIWVAAVFAGAAEESTGESTQTKQGEEMFFFEKKNQKTFGPGAAGTAGGR